MPVTHLTVAAGAQLSSMAVLAPLGRSFAIFAASHATAATVHVAFSTQSGGDWGSLRRTDGSGLVHIVHSGGSAGWGILRPPTPWCRIELSAGPSSEARSFSLVPFNG